MDCGRIPKPVWTGDPSRCHDLYALHLLGMYSLTLTQIRRRTPWCFLFDAHDGGTLPNVPKTSAGANMAVDYRYIYHVLGFDFSIPCEECR